MTFKLQEGGTTAEPPSTQTECKTCASAGTKPQPIRVVTSPQYYSQDAAIELIGRVNEAGIFVGDIQITALIDTGSKVSTITQDFCDKHRYEIHPVK